MWNMVLEYRIGGARVIHDGRYSSTALNPGAYFLDLGFDWLATVFRHNFK